MEYFLYIKAALDHIERHLHEEIRPADVAAMSCFSASHFHTVFRAAVGIPLAAYIRRRRLCHAARDLVETDGAILDIALSWGFESHEAFIRAFRKEFGCAPSGFRKAGRAMDSGIIVPGIFGPMPPRKERTMETGKRMEKGPGYAVLHGVPEVSYFLKSCELTPYPSSLRACLGYMGQDVPYEDLLTASGAAFRLMWNTECWDGGNVDILGVTSHNKWTETCMQNGTARSMDKAAATRCQRPQGNRAHRISVEASLTCSAETTGAPS